MKQGYKPFIMAHGVAKMSISSYGVTFNNAAVKRLNCAKYVNIYVNQNEKMIAIEPSEEKGLTGCDFFEPNNRGDIFVRWNHKEILQYLTFLMGWDLSRNRYQVKGTVDYINGIIEFDLKKAVRHGDTRKSRQGS